MHLCRKDVGELVKGQCGLVREDADALGPEPGGYQVFMLTGREMDESVDASTRSGNAAAANVLEE